MNSHTAPNASTGDGLGFSTEALHRLAQSLGTAALTLDTARILLAQGDIPKAERSLARLAEVLLRANAWIDDMRTSSKAAAP